MAISLAKGQKINLSKQVSGAEGLSKLKVGLGWDTNSFDGQDFDLDAVLFLTGANGKVTRDEDFIFYGNPKDASESIIHEGDNRTGDGDGDDEVIKVNLTTVPETIQKISIAVTIHEYEERRQNFGQVSNAYIHIVNEADGTELIKYELDEDYSIETALVVAEIYRKDGEWRFAAVGAGYSGGLAALATSFGLSVA